jgi:AraC-like DNA-binding protein
MLGMTKEQFSQVHTTFMVLFIAASILHLYYNWKPMTSYMKNKARQMIVFTKEMVAAAAITIVFAAGTLYELPPFSTFVAFGEGIKESWEKDYGSPPYSHAELSSLKTFAKKMGYDLSQAQRVLQAAGIEFKTTQSLSDIAKENGVSPKAIHELLHAELGGDSAGTPVISGLGRKSIEEVAQVLGMSTRQLQRKLQGMGIAAAPDDKFKTVAEDHDKSPADIIEALGFAHE